MLRLSTPFVKFSELTPKIKVRAEWRSRVALSRVPVHQCDNLKGFDCTWGFERVSRSKRLLSLFDQLDCPLREVSTTRMSSGADFELYFVLCYRRGSWYNFCSFVQQRSIDWRRSGWSEDSVEVWFWIEHPCCDYYGPVFQISFTALFFQIKWNMETRRNAQNPALHTGHAVSAVSEPVK